jgi:hypothetical protein
MSEFSELFDRSADIFTALKIVVERSSADGGVIDPADVVREVLTVRPHISLSRPELFTAVVQAAADAGVEFKSIRCSIENQA